MLIVIMLNVVLLSVIPLSVVLLSVIVLSVVLLNVNVLNVVMLSAVVPYLGFTLLYLYLPSWDVFGWDLQNRTTSGYVKRGSTRSKTIDYPFE